MVVDGIISVGRDGVIAGVDRDGGIGPGGIRLIKSRG